jgi:hypothetical protein
LERIRSQFVSTSCGLVDSQEARNLADRGYDGAAAFSKVLLLFCVLCLTAQADSVITAAGQQSGTLSLKNGVLLLNSKETKWDALQFIRRYIKQRFTAPNFIHLRNGESWAGRVLGLKNNKLVFFVEPLGQHEIDMQLIAAISFRAGHRISKLKTGRAYRLNGKPVSGELFGIDAKQIQLKTALGRFNFPRNELAGYVFADSADAGPADKDHAGLVNGALIFGEASLKGRHVILKHAMLGPIGLDLTAIQYLRRANTPIQTSEKSSQRIQGNNK